MIPQSGKQLYPGPGKQKEEPGSKLPGSSFDFISKRS